MLERSLGGDVVATNELLYYQIERINQLYGAKIIDSYIDDEYKQRLVNFCTNTKFEIDSIPFCVIPALDKKSIHMYLRNIFDFMEINFEINVPVSDLNKIVRSSIPSFHLIKDVFLPKFANLNINNLLSSKHKYKGNPCSLEDFMGLYFCFPYLFNSANLVPFICTWKCEGRYEEELIIKYLSINIKNKNKFVLEFADGYANYQNLRYVNRTVAF